MNRLVGFTLFALLFAAPAVAQRAADPPEDGAPDSDSAPDTGSGGESRAEPGSDEGSGQEPGGESEAEADSEGEAGPPSDAGPESTSDAPSGEEPDGDRESAGEPPPASQDDSLFPEDEDDLFAEDDDLAELFETDDELSMAAVVVTAQAERDERALDTGGSVVRLDEALLERFNYDNPDAVVQQVPGAYVRQEDGYGLRPNIGLRGVSSERSSRITLLEDGVLFGPAPYAAPAAYYFPVMTRMTGVDVFMGAASIPYGPTTVGGAIDLRNREIPYEDSAGADLALGSNWFGRAHGHMGTSNDWGGFLLEGVYLRSDGFKHYQSQDEDMPNTGFDRGEAVLRTELHGAISEDVYQRLELRLGISGELSNETYLGLTDDDFRADPHLRYDSSELDRMEWWRTQVQLRHTLDVGDDFQLRTTAYRHDLDRAWNKVNTMGGLRQAGQPQVRHDLYDVLLNPTGSNAVLAGVLRGYEDSEGLPTSTDYILIGTNARRYGVTGLQSDGSAEFGDEDLGHRLRIGARIHHDAVDRDHTENAYGMLGGELVRPTASDYTTLKSHAEALAVSAYLAWSLTFFETLTLSPGIRTEFIWTSYRNELDDAESSAFRTAFIPGASAQWQALDELSFFAGIMRGFAPVSPGQAENVEAEDSINYELGGRFEMPVEAVELDAQVTGFVTDYSNYLQRCSFSSGCAADMLSAEGNGGQPLVVGVDLRAGAAITVGDATLPLRASYTFTYSELRTHVISSPSPLFVGGKPGDHLPYLPEHQVSVQAGVEFERYGLNASGTFVSSMWEGVGQGDDPVARTDAIFLLDASVYAQLWGPVRIYVRGENLTLTQAVASRRPFGARPSRPFQVQVGISLKTD